MTTHTSNNRILVTGAAGFIGSHLCERLIADGNDVVGIDDLSTGSLDNLRSLREQPRFELIVGSIEDQADLPKMMAGTSFVFHLAAPVGVARILAAPATTFRSALTSALAVLDSAAAVGVPVLTTSSSEVYGKSPSLPFRETDDRTIGAATTPRWTYATSKMVEETLTLHHSISGVPAGVVVRLFNVVGPRQVGEYGMVLPRFVDAAMQGADLVVHSDGEQTRCFTAVSDVVDALTALAGEHRARGQVFNVGSTTPTRIVDLAEQVRQQCDSNSSIVHMDPRATYGPDFDDTRHRVPAIDAIHDLTGWSPTRSLASIIDELVAAPRTQAVVRPPHTTTR